jgi:GNAT superfamily N-acetyltransferase
MQIRDMTEADIDAAVAMMVAGGWGERRPFMEAVLAVPCCEPLVGTVDGRVVATGLVTVNGAVGWVGSIFVDPAMRGRGLGRAMTEEVCRRLEAAGCETLALIASELGRPIYERMGFRIDGWYQVHRAAPLPSPPVPPPGVRLRPMLPADLERVGALDRRATGEDRSVLLGSLVDRGWVLEDGDGGAGGRLRGFLVAINADSGALVAPDPADALVLLHQLRFLGSGRTGVVRSVVLDVHVPGRRLLAETGWEWSFQTPRMLRGPAIVLDPSLIWGVLGFAFG